ncbi:MAG: hypothetical protein K6F57_00290 [Candidatus Saccharibacteria bacterium]|nr:hypothetical protein [Candidatus Saccharibacteria bacterium]
MDAQSLHKHIQSSTKQRIHAKPADNFSNPQAFKNDEAIKSELHKEEFDRNGDGVVSLMEELSSIDSVRETANLAAEKLNSEQDKKEEQDINPEKNDEALPRAAILTMHEEKRPGFNAFSSHHASAPAPRQNHQAPVEEAKPVKDNTNAIIMILLIAILIIAVAIFGAIVLGEHRRDQEANQARSSLDVTDNNQKQEEEKPKEFEYDFTLIVGKWDVLGDNKACLEISKDSKVTWYQDCDNTKADYFSGQANIVSGQDAIDKLGITAERAARMVGVAETKVSVDRIFAITVTPEEYVIEGNSSAQKPEEIKLLVVKTDDNEINVYDYHYGQLSIYSAD